MLINRDSSGITQKQKAMKIFMAFCFFYAFCYSAGNESEKINSPSQRRRKLHTGIAFIAERLLLFDHFEFCCMLYIIGVQGKKIDTPWQLGDGHILFSLSGGNHAHVLLHDYSSCNIGDHPRRR